MVPTRYSGAKGEIDSWKRRHLSKQSNPRMCLASTMYFMLMSSRSHFTTKCFAIILNLYIVFLTSKYMCTFLQTGFRGRRCCYKEILSRRPKRRSSLNIWTLKGQCHKIFYFRFLRNHLPPVQFLDYAPSFKVLRKFSKKLLCSNKIQNRSQKNSHSCVPLNIW